MLNMPKITGPFAARGCKRKFSGLRIGGTNRNLRIILKIISKLPLLRDYPGILSSLRLPKSFDV
jgi:hypothetical protein